ncbi:MAG TPA: GGDEF domain-containing protein [Stellaceae bacterium]|nr:GGDEF domain-containing protein [Stellaceae bacterium]
MFLSDEGRERASEIAKSALSYMDQLGIPPYPRHFCVWYTHAMGEFPDLSRTISTLLSNSRPVTEEVSEELFERFFSVGREHSALRTAMQRVQETALRLLGSLGDAGANTDSYSATLREITGNLQESQHPQEIRQLGLRLLEETQAMQRKMELVGQEFSTSAQVIQQLRVKLEGATRDALTDGLTGIANRKAFDMRLREAAMDAMETGSELCLLMLDIDHFKRFNDKWGHQTGDQALMLVAKTLVDNVKGRDLTARYGGEEFSVILPRTLLSDAVILAKQIQQGFAAKKLIMKGTGERIGSITVSIGVTRFEPGEALARFIARADAALYTAKRGGRNRVIAEEPERQLAAAP